MILLEQVKGKQAKPMLFDANGKILGRLSTAVAKSLLNGNDVVVVNAEGAVISGDRKSIIDKYRTRVNLLEKANPEHSPYWPRRPDLLVKRIIRGMLPYRKPSGKAAYRRLKVYIGMPSEFSSGKLIEIESKDPTKMYVGHMTVSELSNALGYERS